MKKTSALLLLLCACLLACSAPPKRDKLIVGKWGFDKVDASQLQEQLSAADDMKVGLMEGMMKGLTYEFFEDKTFRMQAKTLIGSGEKNGTYQLVHDGMAIEMTKNSDNAKQKDKLMNILVLNQDSMVLEESGVKLIFLRTQ
jgi:hypothetical protein